MLIHKLCGQCTLHCRPGLVQFNNTLQYKTTNLQSAMYSLYANFFFTLESSSSVISDVDKVLSAIWEFRGSVLLELKTMQKTQSDVQKTQAEQNTGLLGLEHNVTHLKQELSTVKKEVYNCREELSGVKKYQNHQKKQDQIVTKQDQIHSTLKNDVVYMPPPVMSTPIMSPMAAGSHRSLSSSQKMPPPPSFADNTSTEYDLDSLMNSVFDDIDSQLFNPEIDSGVCPTQGNNSTRDQVASTVLVSSEMGTNFAAGYLHPFQTTNPAKNYFASDSFLFPAHAPGQSCSAGATPTGNDNHFFSSTQQSTIEDSKNPLPQKERLLSVDEVFDKYKKRLEEGEKGDNTGFMACKLAREVFFGDSVLSRSTITGNSGKWRLDPSKLDHLLSVVHSKLHRDLDQKQFKESFHAKCKKSIGSACKRLRQMDKKQ